MVLTSISCTFYDRPIHVCTAARLSRSFCCQNGVRVSLWLWLPPKNKVMCLFVCVSVRLLKKLRTDFDDFLGEMIDYISLPIRIRSRNYFTGFFIYYCDSCRQPRIKHENPRRKFELSECFSVALLLFVADNEDISHITSKIYPKVVQQSVCNNVLEPSTSRDYAVGIKML